MNGLWNDRLFFCRNQANTSAGSLEGQTKPRLFSCFLPLTFFTPSCPHLLRKHPEGRENTLAFAPFGDLFIRQLIRACFFQESNTFFLILYVYSAL